MAKTPTKLTIDSKVLAEARALKMNISAAAESGIRMALKARKEEQWKKDNKDAIEAHNRQIDRDGLWSEDLRMF